jgi:NAD+ synthase (glutamine-hydrolysing)
MGKAAVRENLFRRQCARAECPIVYVNQVGGNDELVFDGCSAVVWPDGRVVARAKAFEEDLLIVDLDNPTASRVEPLAGDVQRLWEALRTGLRDYATKCGFGSAVLGLSGGIDSAVAAVLAADALKGENVLAIAMPSRYSSGHSVSDAEQLARNVGLDYREVSIEPIHAAFEQALQADIDPAAAETAAENVQARIRGTIVMAYSNALGHLPLATGNKSELSVGYCTLYGDMAGGLAPLGDVYKMQVYRLAEHVNAVAGTDRIPRNIIHKAPSAELKPDQTDQDKLPEYPLLDAILERYIEQDMTAGAIAREGYDREVVQNVVRMVDLAEYKRKQAAPVLKVTARAFGQGRRMPIAQRYRHEGE